MFLLYCVGAADLFQPDTARRGEFCIQCLRLTWLL